MAKAKKPYRHDPEDPSTYRLLTADAFKKALLGETVPSTLPDGSTEEWSAMGKDITGVDVVIFDGIRVEEKIHLQEEQVYPYLIEIRHALFQSGLSLSGGEFQQGLGIDGGEFQQEFWISGGEFQQRFWILGGEFQQEFWISGGKFQRSFRILGGEFQSGFRILGGEFQQEFWIRGGEFQQRFWILGGEFQQAFWISGGEFQQLQIKNYGRFIFYLKLSVEIDFSCYVQHSKIGTLEFSSRIRSDGAVYLKKLQLNTLLFNDCTNEGLVTVNDLSVLSHSEEKYKTTPSTFEISNSELGKCHFINTRFEQFEKIIIRDSRLSDIQTSRGHIPLASGGKQVMTDINGEQDAEIMEETYNQLHGAMKRSDNRTWENRYYAEHIEWHRRRLKKDNIEPYTRFTLWLHKYSTAYGQNWLQGMGLLLGIAAGFYLLLCFAQWGYIPTYDGFFENMGYHLGHYFNFILPIHRTNFLGEEMTDWALTVDFISRVVIGFLLYQIIAAFRRFGRR